MDIKSIGNNILDKVLLPGHLLWLFEKNCCYATTRVQRLDLTLLSSANLELTQGHLKADREQMYVVLMHNEGSQGRSILEQLFVDPVVNTPSYLCCLRPNGDWIIV